MSNKEKDPVISINTSRKTISVDLYKEFYHRDAVLKAAYKFGDDYFVKVAPSGEHHVRVTFEARPECNTVLELVAKRFCNEVLDQQIREDLNKTNGHIRNIIYEHAFAPIKDLEGALADRN